ncbi:MAG: hypothetical protein GXP58_10025 [Deltaproteobacteria bacterium]|nr:hypothetical protein [Deltaproteobacteria bacterium]
MRRTFRTISAYGFILGLLLVTACPAAKDSAKAAPDTPAVKQSAELPAGVVAEVNHVEIPATDLTQAVNAALGQNPQIKGMVTSEKQMNDFKKTVLQKMIETELLNQEGKKLKIDDLNSLVDAKIVSLKKSFPGEEGFKKALAKQKMTEADLRGKVEKSIRIKTLLDEKIRKGITVSDDEVKAFYEKNKDKMKEPESVRASHILIRVAKNAPKKEEAAARKKIDALLARVKKGEDFNTLARENSEDPSAKMNGGDLGYFTHGQMVPEFDQAAFSLKVGQTSDVIRTFFGFHIIKCMDRKPGREIPLKEASKNIRKYLEEAAFRTKLSKYLDSLQQAATIQTALKTEAPTPK